MLLSDLVVLALALGFASGNDYCNICSDHTKCLFKGVSPACLDGEQVVGVSQKDKDTIVSYHNILRDFVASGKERRGNPGPQPPAANMQLLSWDEELADIAQLWADQCNYDHDSCRNVIRFYVGQNIAEINVTPCGFASRTPNWTEIIQEWYNEVDQMDYRKVSAFAPNRPTASHYTQIVWATTTKVGCGYRFYERTGVCYSYYVCNYGEGGNLLGYPVYQEGYGRPLLSQKGEDGRTQSKIQDEYEEYYDTPEIADSFSIYYDEEENVNTMNQGNMYDDDSGDTPTLASNDYNWTVNKGSESLSPKTNHGEGEFSTEINADGQLAVPQREKDPVKAVITTPQNQTTGKGSAEKEIEAPTRTYNEASSCRVLQALLIVAPLVIFSNL